MDLSIHNPFLCRQMEVASGRFARESKVKGAE
jgi:hypothetical protein